MLTVGIACLESKTLYDIADYCRRLEGEQLVVDVGVRLEEPHVAKSRCHTLGIVANFILYHHRCVTCVDARCTQQVEATESKAEYHRKHEPFPACEAEKQEVVYVDSFFILLVLLEVDSLCHGGVLLLESVVILNHNDDLECEGWY